MEQDQRIPIDIHAEDIAITNAREIEREDGTLVVDILATPCVEPAADDAIVVCGRREDDLAERYADADAPDKLQLRFGETGTATATAETGDAPMGGLAQQIGVTVKLKF